MSTVRVLRPSIACAALASGALALGALAGCGPDDYNPGPETCDRSEEHNPPIRYTQGTVENGVYMTSDWDGELLHFPGGMHYELVHHLGETPRYFQAYLSFDRYGVADEGTIAVAQGNQVELVRVNDQAMVVRNAECVDYWLLVVAAAGVPPAP